MLCPFCSSNDTRVIDSRLSDGGKCVRRRRECIKCTRRFTSYERYEEAPLFVIKKDGRREPFDIKKLLNGIVIACQKRPVSYAQIEQMATNLERALRCQSQSEVKSVVIGCHIMSDLRNLDEVAYVRFASVYKEFKDVSHFSQELRDLEQSRK